MALSATIKKLRTLNKPVPKPLRLPTEAEVQAAEQQLGVPFHPDYRYFLLHASDINFGALEPAVVIPGMGYRELVEMAPTAWEVQVPRDLLPFCEDNGSFFCLKPDGSVVYWDHNGPTAEAWPNLADWIDQVWIGEAEEEDEVEADEE